MEKRNMLILWHWKRIRQKDRTGDLGRLSESVQVADSPGGEISREVMILDEGDGVPQRIIDNIKAIMRPDAITQQNPGKWLVFLHKDSFDQRKFPHLTEQLERELKLKPDKDFELIPFGGGDHFIYYKKVTNTGLLDQYGRFMHRECGNASQPDDPMQFRSVLTNPETEKRPEKPVIKAEFFDQVWNYYSFHYKRNLYEFQEQLLTRFVAEQPKEASSLLEYLEQTDQNLKVRLENICTWKQIKSARLDQIYNSDTININKMYNELVRFISREPINSTNFRTYLIELRERFYRLLEAMPESIY